MTFGESGSERPQEVIPAESAAAQAPASPPSGATPARRTGRGRRRRPRKKLTFAQELPFLVLAALALAIIIKAFIVQAFYIPSGSMERTLHGCPGCQGDRVMVNKLVYDFRSIHRGDIVVFDGKDNYQAEATPAPKENPIKHAARTVADWIGLAPEGTDYIKRVIGLPGDHVQCCDAQGRVSVNGQPLDESSYVYQDDHEPFDVHVPAGKIWVMGDHRGFSYDSRKVKAIPEKDVIGRAFAIIWPPSRMRWLSAPATFSHVPKAASAAPLLLSIALVGGVTAVRRRPRRRARSR